MTEPKELRSIDELFRNTFNNLPDTPADNGWDTPSEQVWAHVQKHAQPPANGWNMQTLIILAGFAVTLVVGLYFAFSAPNKAEEHPVQPVSSPVVVETTAVAPALAAPMQTERSMTPAVVAVPKVSRPATRPVAQPKAVEPQMVQPANQEIKPIRPAGAAPLPGSNTTIAPNTTEARKAAQAKKLEELWRTPLPLLPVPKNQKQ